MRCWFCGGHMVWQSDFNYEDVFGEGEGLVSILICADCGAETQWSLAYEQDTPGGTSELVTIV